MYQVDEVVLIDYPYVPEFLAIREAKLLANIVKKSPLKADLLILDGNGKYHSRCKFNLYIDA